MTTPDPSQLDFCQSPAPNIRLLAPAGCGKTASLLHRCAELTKRSTHRPRFLLVTFTRSAAAELRERLHSQSEFRRLQGQTSITTLNAYGWSRIRTRVSSPRLLTSPTDLFFAMKNQLHPVWASNRHLAPVVSKAGGTGARTLMKVMDNLKSMGFVHTRDVNADLYSAHFSSLESQGLTWRIAEQFELLTSIGVLESPKHGNTEGPATSHRQFYDRFFTFWRKATNRLLEESTFTYQPVAEVPVRGCSRCATGSALGGSSIKWRNGDWVQMAKLRCCFGIRRVPRALRHSRKRQSRASSVRRLLWRLRGVPKPTRWRIRSPRLHALA